MKKKSDLLIYLFLLTVKCYALQKWKFDTGDD